MDCTLKSEDCFFSDQLSTKILWIELSMLYPFYLTCFQCFFDGEQGVLYMYVGRYDDINKLKNLHQLFDTQNSHLIHHQELTKLKHEAGTSF